MSHTQQNPPAGVIPAGTPAAAYALGYELRPQAPDESFAGLAAVLPFPVTVQRGEAEGEAAIVAWLPRRNELRITGGWDTTDRGCMLLIGMHLLRDAEPLPECDPVDWREDPERFEAHSAAAAAANDRLCRLARWFVAGWYGEQPPTAAEEGHALGERLRRQAPDDSLAALLAVCGRDIKISRTPNVTRGFAQPYGPSRDRAGVVVLPLEADERAAVSLVGSVLLAAASLSGDMGREARLRELGGRWTAAEAFAAGWYGEALPAGTPDAGSTEGNQP